MRWLAAVTVLALLPLLGCSSRDYTWRQKLTVIVNTPSGERSGSSVTEFHGAVGYALDVGRTGNSGVIGEAVVIDLGNNKYVFVLLDEDINSLAWSVFEDELPKNGKTEIIWSALENFAGKTKVIPQKLYPRIVTFNDVKNPRTIVEVKPEAFSTILGHGYSLKSLLITITKEPVTDGRLAALIPWATKLTGSIAYADERLPYNNLLMQVNNESFLRGHQNVK